MTETQSPQVRQHSERDRNGRLLAAWREGVAAAEGDILGGLTATLEALAAELIADAEQTTKARKKGHVTAAKLRTDAAGLVTRIAISTRTAGVPESDFPAEVRRAPISLASAQESDRAQEILNEIAPGLLAGLPNMTIRIDGKLVQEGAAPVVDAEVVELCGERVPYSSSEDYCHEPKGHAGNHAGEHNRWPNTAPTGQSWPEGATVIGPDVYDAEPVVFEELTLDETVSSDPPVMAQVESNTRTLLELTRAPSGSCVCGSVEEHLRPLDTCDVHGTHATHEENESMDLPKIAAPDAANGAAPRDPALVKPWVPNESALLPHKAYRSVSQIELYENCGMSYRLKYRDGVTQAPSWALVGGSAFHACAEKIVLRFRTYDMWKAEGFPNRVALTPGELWRAQFADQIAKSTLESGTGPAKWAAANNGTEDREWWDREGPEMVRRFVDWWFSQLSEGWRVAMNPATGAPGVEWEITSTIGGVEVLSKIDLVVVRPSYGQMRIVDYKSGRLIPFDDPFQLGVYRDQMTALGAPYSITTSYYDARIGALKTATPPSPTEVAYRVAMMDNGERADIYAPNTKTKYGCGSCFAREACPVGFIPPVA